MNTDTHDKEFGCNVSIFEALELLIPPLRSSKSYTTNTKNATPTIGIL